MSPGVAGAAFEHPLERVESNEVRTRGIPPPPIIRKRVMLKATYSEEDKCWSVSLKRLILMSRVGESEA